MDVNAMAHMWLAKAFLPDMIKTNCGHIVTIASAAGLCGVNGLADYCASKFAAVGFDGMISLFLSALLLLLFSFHGLFLFFCSLFLSLSSRSFSLS
jgi:hypothetical protein